MRLLFVKDALVWPRSSGHDVHTFYMMKACADLGHEVSLATVTEPTPEALEGLPLACRWRLDTPVAGDTTTAGTWIQRRFRSFWGVSEIQIENLRRVVADWHPHAVIVVGLDALPYFPAISGPVRIWYAADEWALHHLSQLRPTIASWREHLYAAAVKWVYERAHRQDVDRVWVVSRSDQRAMRWLAGMRHVDVLPNGVDGELFAPGDGEPVHDQSAVFWGRLDFGPNIQALAVVLQSRVAAGAARVPDARVHDHRVQPERAVRSSPSRDGMSLAANLRDLRDEARQPRGGRAAVRVRGRHQEQAARGGRARTADRLHAAAAEGLRGQIRRSISARDAGRVRRGHRWSSGPMPRADADRERRSGLGGQHHTWAATARDAMGRSSWECSAMSAARRPPFASGSCCTSCRWPAPRCSSRKPSGGWDRAFDATVSLPRRHRRPGRAAAARGRAGDRLSSAGRPGI